jgi:histidyl-tRNA synthetase
VALDGSAGGPLQSPRGTRDVLWPESWRWEVAVARFAQLAERSGFGLVVTPVFEDVRVFRRGIGDESEVVGKEMYEFTDRGGRHLALRPEGTASVVRAFVQHRPPLPYKAWYLAPAFRYERAAAGRYRQHHQLGVEALGVEDPELDVEVVVLAADFYRSLGLERVSLAVNSMGCRRCRPAYLEALRAYLRPRVDQLCKEHVDRVERSPLRILDCKTDACRAATEEAPRLLDWLDEECAAHFARVRQGLGEAQVHHRVEPRLVRGFDYYTRTTFEFSAEALEAAQNAVGGGGRYDGLVAELGGPPTPGIGFGIGLERVLLACDAEGILPPADAPRPQVFVVDLEGGAAATSLVVELRRAGVAAERAYGQRSLKAQLRQADRLGAELAVIIGREERTTGTATVRFLATAEQRRVPLAGLREFLLAQASPVSA